jgi:hypothetical protein
MEQIGSRKILLSQNASLWKEDSLKHLAEETRHAYFFRRAAEKLSSHPLNYSDHDTLAPWAARAYFGRLDALITRELGADRHLAYRYVTLAVELRAQWFYGIYEEILHSKNLPISLSSVLAEEDGHLRDMSGALTRSDANYDLRRQIYSELESELFDRWLAATILIISSP